MALGNIALAGYARSAGDPIRFDGACAHPPPLFFGSLNKRWVQLLAGIVCMVMISSLQHGWTLFVHPINQKYEWGRAAIQVAFTIFILTETWLVPFEGWVVDRLGPKPVAIVGGLLVGIAWSLNSVADSLPLLYLGAALGGIGAG